MVAPKARTQRLFDRLVGIALYCPECPTILASMLRVETVADYTTEVPELVANAGPLGFIARCDACGFRVEMHGDRLPTVAMLKDAE